MTRKRARITDENNPLTSTDEVLAGFQQLSQSTSQQPEVLTIEKSSNTTIQKVEKLDVDKANKLESQQVSKLTTQKATFQLSQSVLEQLERFHLELQLELGKKNTPYKEVIVEEAIAQLLTQLVDDQQSIIQKLRERQQQRK